MKPMTGKGAPVEKGDVTAAEMLRYAMSLPVATTLCGINTLEHPGERTCAWRASFAP